MKAPRKQSATTTNAAAVPWPATTRSAMPTATVAPQTRAPLPSDAGARRARVRATHPTASPLTNGHAVEAMPSMLRPWAWTARPIPTKRRTATRSNVTAARRISATGTGSVRGPEQPVPGVPQSRDDVADVVERRVHRRAEHPHQRMGPAEERDAGRRRDDAEDDHLLGSPRPHQVADLDERAPRRHHGIAHENPSAVEI